jgi:hypothetical protein
MERFVYAVQKILFLILLFYFIQVLACSTCDLCQNGISSSSNTAAQAKNEISDFKCAICLESFDQDARVEDFLGYMHRQGFIDCVDQDRTLVLGTPCKHYFDESCLVEWCKKSATCPHCRRPLFSEDDVITKCLLMNNVLEITNHEKLEDEYAPHYRFVIESADLDRIILFNLGHISSFSFVFLCLVGVFRAIYYSIEYPYEFVYMMYYDLLMRFEGIVLIASFIVSISLETIYRFYSDLYSIGIKRKWIQSLHKYSAIFDWLLKIFGFVTQFMSCLGVGMLTGARIFPASYAENLVICFIIIIYTIPAITKSRDQIYKYIVFSIPGLVANALGLYFWKVLIVDLHSEKSSAKL